MGEMSDIWRSHSVPMERQANQEGGKVEAQSRENCAALRRDSNDNQPWGLPDRNENQNRANSFFLTQALRSHRCVPREALSEIQDRERAV